MHSAKTCFHRMTAKQDGVWYFGKPDVWGGATKGRKLNPNHKKLD